MSSRVVVHGVPFDVVSEDDLVAKVVGGLDDDPGGLILTANVDIVRQLQDDVTARLARLSRFVVADGQPVVWASRLQGTPLPDVVTGSSLIGTLSAAALDDGRRVMLVGGPEGAAERAAGRLRRRHPAGTPVAWYCPPMGFDREDEGILELVDRIRAARPHLVFLGLGFPKQEFVAEWLLTAFPDVWFVGCGGAISMLAGDLPRAPRWMRRLGVEWLHRLRLEPRRLAHRYLVTDAPFAVRMLLGSGLRHPSLRPGRAS